MFWNLGANKVIVTRDAVFFKDIYPFSALKNTVYLPSVQNHLKMVYKTHSIYRL